MKSEQISLGNNSSIIVFESLTIKVTDIVFESIEADPFDSEAYPAGSGVTVYLSAIYAGESTEFIFTKLSDPYDSEIIFKWEAFEVELVEVSSAGTSFVILVVSRLERV
ncbi:hypothetical protein [Marinicellulosiphila megalodicopiae]|uniref:hypothetical protein n=1 Tax=Marinicellulosiphila megalodicopiae TaxID=2724896 RepID=UPI003BB04F15